MTCQRNTYHHEQVAYADYDKCLCGCLKSVLILALEAGIVAALVLFPPLEAWVKSFTNVFMVGRSSGAMLFLVETPQGSPAIFI